MTEDLFTFYQMPQLHDPVLIVGFGEWSNAGNVALKSIDYIIEKKRATLIAEIDPDYFLPIYYKTDPVVTIKKGRLHRLDFKKDIFLFLS